MKKILLLIFVFFIYSCPKDELTEEQTNEFSCCGVNPFESTNIDNLDQSAGEIMIGPYFTPNNDGVHDFWSMRNIHLYSNVSLDIFDANDKSIYSSTDFNQTIGWSGDNREEGVYRYKLIIENEQTYLQQGYFCLILSSNTELTTAECDPNWGPDPIIDK